MPELTTVWTQECGSDSVKENVLSSKGTEEYEVFVSRSSEYDACTCPGFQYRGKCKHVTALREKLCDWTEQKSEITQSPQQEMEGICPKCGSETKVIVVN